MNENQRSHRGTEAARILENEIFKEALNALDSAYVKAWRDSKTIEAREDAFRYVQLTAKFKSDLEAVLKDGKVADHRLIELEGQKKGLRRILG